MKIITENEILVERQGTNMDYFYSPASGSKKKKGSLMDKAKGLVGSGKVQGVLAALGNNNAPAPTTVEVGPPPAPAKKKMSTGVKIGIGVGAALLLGAAYYFLVHKKGKGK